MSREELSLSKAMQAWENIVMCLQKRPETWEESIFKGESGMDLTRVEIDWILVGYFGVIRFLCL